MKRYNDRQKRNIVKNNYNAIARVYDENYGSIDSYTKYVREFLNKVDGDRIVELGCGSGAMANYMYECGKQVIAVDFSTSLLISLEGNILMSSFMRQIYVSIYLL